jgi:hypothetical protein
VGAAAWQGAHWTARAQIPKWWKLHAIWHIEAGATPPPLVASVAQPVHARLQAWARSCGRGLPWYALTAPPASALAADQGRRSFGRRPSSVKPRWTTATCFRSCELLTGRSPEARACFTPPPCALDVERIAEKLSTLPNLSYASAGRDRSALAGTRRSLYTRGGARRVNHEYWGDDG